MFQFMTATRIVFGEDALAQSISSINQFGYSVLLVTGKEWRRAQHVVDYLTSQNMRYQHVAIHGEPNITMVEQTAIEGRKFKPDMVIAMGGGSVIDMGKALAAIIPNQGDVYDYVEVVGRNVPLKAKPIHFVAIPTAASTGSEVTRNAVLRSGQDRVKVSLRSSDMHSDLAIIDPTLTYGMDLATSARGAMDAFTHLMEAYVCGDPNPLTDMVCEEGLRRLRDSVLKACLFDEPRARADLSFAAMLGGMASSNAKLGAAHGLAAALGGKLDAPHSIIKARLAPHVMDENLAAAVRENRDDVIERYKKISQILTRDPLATPQQSIEWITEMIIQLKIPLLSQFGVCGTEFETVAKDALKSHSIKGNPLPLTEERLISILEKVCDCAISSPMQEPLTASSVEILKSGLKQHTPSSQQEG